MGEPIVLIVSKETPVNASWHRVPIGQAFITPEIARQIVAMARHAKEEAQFPPDARIVDKPAAPAPVADDEATIKALDDAYGIEVSVSLGEMPFHLRGIRSQVAKIRRGEVPGVTTIAEAQEALAAAHAWADVEIKRLHVERDNAIAAANTSRQGSAEGYRETIREIAAERDAAKAALASEKERADINLAEANRRAEEINRLRGVIKILEADVAEAKGHADAMKASGEDAVIAERNQTYHEHRRAEHFRANLVGLPDCKIIMRSQQDLDAWEAWKARTFDAQGNPLEPKAGGA